MNADNSPYRVPEVSESVAAMSSSVLPKSSPGIIWRVLSVVLYVSAGVSLATGVDCVAMLTWILIYDSVSGYELLTMMAVCTLYLGFGIAWVLSGFCFWTGRLRFAFVTCLAGLAFPTAFYQIFGW